MISTRVSRSICAVIVIASAFALCTHSVAQTTVTQDDWPAYARTHASDRYAPQAQITPQNASRLKELCRYDVGETVSFQTGPLAINGTIYGTTEKSTFAIDALTCALRWKTTEEYKTKNPLKVNRGAAFGKGRLFRGTQDGRVIAYDAETGKRSWETFIANPELGESVPAAPLAWQDWVFIGNSGGDNKGVKGRMYALNATTGAIVWEQYLVPRGSADLDRGPAAPAMPLDKSAQWNNATGIPVTGGATWANYSLDETTGELYVSAGNPAPDFAAHLRSGQNLLANAVVVLDARSGAYKRHFLVVERDYHDWDLAAAPILFTTAQRQHIMAAAAKDGHLYGYDLATGQRLYREPVTTIENETAPFSATWTRFCPGTQGGVEWNGPSYSPLTDFVYTGAVDWCTRVRLGSDAEIKQVPVGQPFTGMDSRDTPKFFGVFDPAYEWAGWINAVDAATGQTRWRRQTLSPILAPVTPTAGAIVLTADMAGTFYVLDAYSGGELFRANTDGAVGGGIISYAVNGVQRIAVASGMVSSIWPTPVTTAKIIIYGVPTP